MGYENLVDLDRDGNLVALTIEHARKRNILPELSVEHAPA